MTIKKIILLFGVLLLITCNNPTKNNATAFGPNAVKDTCCIKDSASKNIETSMRSEITCPKCGYKKTETMPTDVCLIKYTCKKCQTELLPKSGDCCVFCTYGTHKCPSMQGD